MKSVRDTTRATVLQRSQFRCERCGVRQMKGLHMSHRQARGMGGSSSRGRPHDRPSNVNSLCAKCHLGHVEKYPAKAMLEGWRVPHGSDVLEVPIQMYDGVFLLDDEGGRIPYGGLLPS